MLVLTKWNSIIFEVP